MPNNWTAVGHGPGAEEELQQMWGKTADTILESINKQFDVLDDKFKSAFVIYFFFQIPIFLYTVTAQYKGPFRLTIKGNLIQMQ